MGRFNLLDEPWIPVLVETNGDTKNVSLIDLFENAHNYIGLACDTKTQEFAILRILLAITNTVFSRFDATGEVYDSVEIDDKYRQLCSVSEDDSEEYSENLLDTWESLWELGRYPRIIMIYLEKWRDRFYLFDDQYPFFRVLENEVSEEFLNKKNPSSISGKNINRIISESGNKVALFSPKSQHKNNKEILSAEEVARWIITFQGYTGLSDKVIFGNEKYKASKGWLFDLGGVYLEGDNVFETLLLNMIMIDDYDYYLNVQKPS